jgi:Asp-tRNA(Asn)/Glu-tRNA(Gln) amidotransferase A subunit family amidase
VGLERLGRAVARGEVGAAELVRLALDRIERLDGKLNAVVALRAELALEEAEALDRRVAAGEPVGRLAGVPLLVKDMEDVTGMRTTFGSLLFADAPPATSDGLVTERLRAVGAIVVGKTNLPEFAAEGYTANLLFGVTRNPWAPEWSPGGSSGGSGAALAAGMAPLATATDGGGSIRIPAAMCGLAGIKPTGGLIGRRPIPDWIDLSTDGPLATGIADLRLLLEIESGPVAGDPTALPVPWRDVSASDGTHRAATIPSDGTHRAGTGASDGKHPAGPTAGATSGRPGRRAWPDRVLAAPRFVDHGPLEPAVAELFEKALLALERDLGVAVEPIEPRSIFGTGDLDADWVVIATTEHAHKLGRELIEANVELLHPSARAFLRVGLNASIEDYLAARRRRFEYVRELDELLGPNGVITTPTLASSGWLAEGRMPGSERLGVPDEVYNCNAANMTGHPSLSLPAGRFESGVGFGLQLTGPRFSDDVLLDLGEAWERARPWPLVAPGYEPFDLP